MDCPRDAHEMIYQGFWKYPRHACAQCGGVFVAERDLTENIGQRDKKFAHVAEVKLDNVTDSTLRCPKDGATMKAVKFVTAEIDVCPSCSSLWLDKGEYEKIVAQIQRGIDSVRPNARLPSPGSVPGVGGEEESDPLDGVLSVVAWFVLPRRVRRMIGID